MADDLDAQLAALEEKADVTPEPHEVAEGDNPDTVAAENAGAGKDGKKLDGEPSADEWKPPTREAYENVQKALRAERDAKREAARRAALYEQNIAAIEQRIQAAEQQRIMQQLQAPAPDPYERPEDARQRIQQQQQALQQLWAAQQQREQQETAQRQQAVQFERLNSAVDDYESAFAAENPDYHEATDHMLGVQQKILEGMGYPPEVAAQQVGMWSVSVAQQALQTGRDPAKAAYELAQTMGYVPASKRQGHQPAQAAAEQLAAIRAGQESAKTLSGGGAGGAGRPSLKSIASLEGAAFDSAMDKFLNDAIRGR